MKIAKSIDHSMHKKKTRQLKETKLKQILANTNTHNYKKWAIKKSTMGKKDLVGPDAVVQGQPERIEAGTWTS